jgi:hypothetical protein
MARPLRSQQIDYSAYRLYHVMTRCVRSLGLLAINDDERKDLIMRYLELLSEATAISVAGFSVMDNHLHLLVHADPEQAEQWSAVEVARRWCLLHPPRNGKYQRMEVDDGYLQMLAEDADWVEATRSKLTSLSQYMKELKQRLAQWANRQDCATGPFWAGRFMVKAVKDEAQLLTTMTYIDLNQFAAGMCATPEEGQYTSLQAHLAASAPDEAEAAGPPLTAAGGRGRRNRPGTDKRPATIRSAGRWLIPLASSRPSRRQPLLPGLTLRSYLLLLDSAARMLREGKRILKRETASILRRLGVDDLHDQVTEMQRYWDRFLPQPVPIAGEAARYP